MIKLIALSLLAAVLLAGCDVYSYPVTKTYPKLVDNGKFITIDGRTYPKTSIQKICRGSHVSLMINWSFSYGYKGTEENMNRFEKELLEILNTE